MQMVMAYLKVLLLQLSYPVPGKNRHKSRQCTSVEERQESKTEPASCELLSMAKAGCYYYITKPHYTHM
jgi:hypothetical protein